MRTTDDMPEQEEVSRSNSVNSKDKRVQSQPKDRLHPNNIINQKDRLNPKDRQHQKDRLDQNNKLNKKDRLHPSKILKAQD